MIGFKNDYLRIRWITIKLDKLFPWQGRGGERLLLQILIGIGLPVLVAFLLAYFSYYQYRDFTIFNTGWWERYSGMVTLMLAIVNAIYILILLQQKHGFLGTVFRDEVEMPPAVASLPTEAGLLNDTILLVIRNDKTTIIYSKEGSYPTALKLEEIFSYLTPVDYELFKKNCIIRRDNILRREDRSDGRVDVHLKVPESKVVIISGRQKERLSGFK